MAVRVNPKLIEELVRYGAEDVQNCYHCGNCTATCPHSDEHYVFPRKSMRQLQMGLEKRIETSLEPWLCYYCGQCSEQCPRDAEPGETMMSLRRWLISRYDFTGLARRFFKSTRAELFAVLLVSLLSAVGFLVYGFAQGNIRIYDGAGAFLPSSFIHIFDLSLGAIVFAILGINMFRFWRLSMGKSGGVSIPWWLYIKKIHLFPWHFLSQKRYADCEKNVAKRLFTPWLVHFGVVFGYVTMLILVMVFVEMLQYGPAIRWSVHAFGYAASIGLLVGTVVMLRGRWKKTRVQYQRSHDSDWIFLVLLFIIVVTGITQHVLHRTGLLVAANIVYILHLMAVVPWLTRMPFTKWAHIVYRPLAMYFADVRKEAVVRAKRSQASEAASQKAAA